MTDQAARQALVNELVASGVCFSARGAEVLYASGIIDGLQRAGFIIQREDALAAAEAEIGRLREAGLKSVAALSEALTLTGAFAGQPPPDTRQRWRQVYYRARAALSAEPTP